MSVVNHIFICGMFRSGTTLIGRMLNAHGEISIASDGIFPFFKFLRNSIVKNSMNTSIHSFEEPLADYYFDEEGLMIYRAIQQASLDEKITEKELHALKKKIKFWCADSDQYSPLLKPYIDEIDADTYKNLYVKLLDAVSVAYADRNTKIVGLKEVWVGEFIPIISEAFPSTKFVYIIRDPRAVLASKSNMCDGKYPWLFMARQWRKQAMLAHIYNSNKNFKNKIHVVRYEDLIENPNKTTQALCAFLELKWDGDMLDTNKFVNGKGESWYQNTAYGNRDDQKKEGFNKETINRWEQRLSYDEIKLIEFLCAPEMKLFGYVVKYKQPEKEVNNILFDLPIYPENELANWIKDYIDNTPEYLSIELFKEKIRYELINQSSSICAEKNRKLLDMCFLDSKFFFDLV